PIRRAAAEAGPAARSSHTEVGEDLQPIAEQARAEEVLARVLLARLAEPLGELGIAQEIERALRRLLDRGDQKARLAVDDLQRDAAHVAADRRPALPERLGDGEPEALANRLLQDYVGL